MTKKKDIKKKRDSLSMLVCRKVFKRGYKTFVPASFIVDALHPLFLHNRQLFLDTFCKREAEPLHKITADVQTMSYMYDKLLFLKPSYLRKSIC